MSITKSMGLIPPTIMVGGLTLKGHVHKHSPHSFTAGIWEIVGYANAIPVFAKQSLASEEACSLWLHGAFFGLSRSNDCPLPQGAVDTSGSAWRNDRASLCREFAGMGLKFVAFRRNETMIVEFDDHHGGSWELDRGTTEHATLFTNGIASGFFWGNRILQGRQRPINQ